MAIAIRCSCFFTRPLSPQSPQSDQFSVKNRLSGKPASLPAKFEKLPSTFGHASCEPFEIHYLVESRKPILPICTTSMQHLPAHQASLHFKFPAAALLITNGVILTAPFQALAETCEAENSLLNMPLLLFVALVGATVGGLLARQRRGELARLNEQLRQINAALRRQAKIESYAPSLSYAPVGTRVAESEVIVDPRKEELISRLKSGKNFLRNQDPEKAFREFKAGLELAQILEDPTEEKKAARGMGASLQRQGKFREAIEYHSMVLQISERMGEDSGNTEAYGAIADCYTELGDLEQAAKFYDQYIARLESD
ncbi:TPR_REGION domain-containing protein [Psidium guajava]|nr:TPR_REGION domain-containing protein [Psidium guajava]